jgi:CheY-like chemotaxis protein
VAGGSFALQALTKAERSGKSFQLVLLDTHMPEMNGFTVAEKIRRSPGQEHVRILMLTSGGSSGEAVRSRGLDISGYITKPVLETELLTAMTAHAMSGDRDKYVAAGMDAYISKPIDAKYLQEIIERICLPECLLEK